MTDLLDLHTHTLASGHAYNSLYEMIHAAAERGLALYGCSDHAPMMPGGPHSFYFLNFRVIPREVFGVKVLMGAELNIMDARGRVDLDEDVLKHLDYTIASLHPPCIRPGTCEENTSAYLHVLANPYVNIIGHPDDARYPIDYAALVKGAKKHRKLLEVNSSSLHPRSQRSAGAADAYRIMLKLCMEEEVSIIVNSDAHIESDVGNHSRAFALLEELCFPPELIVNTNLDILLPYLPRLERVL